MLNKLVEKIDEIVDSIYTPEQPGIDKKVQEFLDIFVRYIEQESNEEQIKALNPNLEKLLTYYERKAYIEMADTLLYDVRTIIQQNKREN